MRRMLAILMTLVLSVCSEARADWPAGGKFVLLTTDSFNLTSSVWITDLPTGELLVRAVGVGGNANGYDVQRISQFGDIATGWPARGVSFGELGKPIREWSQGFALDDQGSAWHAAQVATGVGAQRVAPDGVRVPAGAGWPFTSINVGYTTTAFAPAPGGIYAYFGNRVQRLTRAGVVAAGWPANGRTTSGNFGVENAALADGAGGVVLMTSYGGPIVLRFDSTGTPHGGTVLSDDANDAFADFGDAPQFPDLLASDATHFIAGWTGPYNSSIKHAKLQRVGYDGALDPAWPTSGLEAVAADSITGVTAVPDRSGGLYVLWYAHGMPRGTHVRADGTFEPGTDGAGVPLPAPGASYVLPLRSLGVLPYVPADATADGRLIFAWDDAAIERSIRVRWLLPDLTADPSEPAAGRLIEPNDRKTRARAVHAAPDGGAYIAWESVGTDPTPNADNGEIWMTRLLPSSLVGVAPPSPRASALVLSAPHPNPALDAVALELSLPDDAPARVELLDVAGRIQRSQLVEGAGPHAVTFRDLGTLAPGLYFARASGRAGSTATRVVVSR